jgi:hypothetical protein
VGNIVTYLNTFSGQLATAGHGITPNLLFFVKTVDFGMKSQLKWAEPKLNSGVRIGDAGKNVK